MRACTHHLDDKVDQEADRVDEVGLEVGVGLLPLLLQQHVAMHGPAV